MPSAGLAGMETSMDSPFSGTELRDAILRLNVEESESTSLNSWVIQCFDFSQKDLEGHLLQSFGQLLRLMHRRGSLETQRYSGLELSEWRTCVLQAANRPTRVAKGMPEVFTLYVELAVKGGKWCTQITAGDLQESSSQQDSPVEVPKVQQAVIRLASTVFEAAAEVCLASQSPLFDEPFASTLESLISNSFELVRVLYVSMMKKPSPQPADDDVLRKACQELLSLTYRLVHMFRRQVDDKLPETSDDSQQESSPQSTWLQLPTALRIVAISVQSFTELGKLSTSGGEVSPALLNISWKSILQLLQVEEGRDAVAAVVDIQFIVATLISNAVQATKRALETWLLQPLKAEENAEEKAEEKDHRRLCIPIKFFLMNASKISSFYPLKAVLASRNMVSCASKVYGCLLQKDFIAHKAAIQVFAELVVPCAFALLQNLLNDRSVDEDLKIQILGYITMETEELESSQTITDLDGCNDGSDIVDELFYNKPGGLLKTGRVVLYLSLLQSSSSYSGALLSELLSKLQWLLDEIPEEGTYVLMTRRVYLPYEKSGMSGKWKWQLTFPWVSQAVKIFSVIAAKQEPIWTEFECFLFDQVMHPSVICGELVLDVWCFIIRQSKFRLVQVHVNFLLSLFLDLVRLKAEGTLQRRIARALCVLVKAGPDLVAAEVCDFVGLKNPFLSPDTMGRCTMLLQEGFPLSKPVWDSVLSYCIRSVKGLVDSLKLESRGVESELAVQKCALICLPQILSQSPRGKSIEHKYLEEIRQIVLNLISMYTLDRNNSRMFHNLGIIGPTLELISHVQHLLRPGVSQALLPRLLECCQTTPESSEGRDLKQTLPSFLASLSEVAIQEDENNPAMKALWGLYHLVLREKPWALVHMGLQSFGHFAAHSSCQELWRFVPADAAAVSHGNADEDSFMEALKVVVDKEGLLSLDDVSGKELQFLRTESNLQQQKHTSTIAALRRQRDVEVDMGIEQSTTNLCTEPTPAGNSEIQEAMAMLCKGMGVLEERAPDMLKSEASQEWEALRARLAEMNEQVKALQRRSE